MLKDLTADRGCDSTVRNELSRAGIPAVYGSRSAGEVQASITGKLGPFIFIRRSSYWVAHGPTPLAMAKEIHDDPRGRQNVLASGWDALPPEKAAQRIAGKEYVLCYYIDSLVGLQLFADMARKHVV